MASIRRRRQGGPHRVPPPLTHWEERIDGEVILEELEGDVGLALWKSYRGGVLWSTVPEKQRRALHDRATLAARKRFIEEGLRSEPELRDAVAGIARSLSRRQSGAGSQVAAHCRTVEQWAERRGALQTALLFAQLASLAVPASGALAFNVARRARRMGQFARAESWFRQAIAVSRAAAEWDSYVRAFIGLGITYRLRGSYPAARKVLQRAQHRAARQGRRELEGMAFHELMIVGVTAGRVREVERYGNAALQRYGPGHRRLPALAHDVATFLANSGDADLALRIFQAIPETYGDTADRLIRLGNIVRTAGQLQRTAVFDAAWADAERLLEHPEANARGTGPLRDLAEGALFIGRTDLARRSAVRTVTLAGRRSEAETELDAEKVIAELEARTTATARAATSSSPGMANFAETMIAGLAGVKAGAA